MDDNQIDLIQVSHLMTLTRCKIKHLLNELLQLFLFHFLNVDVLSCSLLLAKNFAAESSPNARSCCESVPARVR